MCIESRKHFNFEINQISLHPSGLHLLAASETHVYFMHILIGNISIYHQFSFSKARVLQVSNGGQFFALSNDKTVRIYEFYDMEMQPIIIL